MSPKAKQNDDFFDFVKPERSLELEEIDRAAVVLELEEIGRAVAILKQQQVRKRKRERAQIRRLKLETEVLWYYLRVETKIMRNSDKMKAKRDKKRREEDKKRREADYFGMSKY